MPEPGQVQRPGHARDFIRRDLKILHQNVEDSVGDGLIGLQPDGPAEAPPPNGFFHRLQKVVALQFLNGHFRVAGDVERMGFDNFKTGEERLDVGGDHLLDPDEFHSAGCIGSGIDLGRFSATLFPDTPAHAGRGDGDQLRQGFGNLYAGKMPASVDDHSEQSPGSG